MSKTRGLFGSGEDRVAPSQFLLGRSLWAIPFLARCRAFTRFRVSSLGCFGFGDVYQPEFEVSFYLYCAD